MKFVVTIMVIFFICASGKAQVNNFRGPDIISYAYLFGGVRFNPVNEPSNKSDSVLCDDYSEEFSLNGLMLDKVTFTNLRLSTKYLRNDSTTFFNREYSKRGYGRYQFYYEGEDNCVNRIVFDLEVKLTIILNGRELSVSEQKVILSKINSNEILSIERRSTLFGAGEIYIQTKFLE